MRLLVVAGAPLYGGAMLGEGPSVVATYSLSTEAQIARALLESNGIQALLRDEGVVGVHPWLSNAVGGVKVVVPAEDAARARDILAAAGRRGTSPVEDADMASERRSEADVLAARALNAAGIGLLLFPPVLHLWSAWLLLRLRRSSSPLGPSGRKHALVALVIDIVVFAAVATIAFRMLATR